MPCLEYLLEKGSWTRSEGIPASFSHYELSKFLNAKKHTNSSESHSEVCVCALKKRLTDSQVRRSNHYGKGEKAHYAEKQPGFKAWPPVSLLLVF